MYDWSDVRWSNVPEVKWPKLSKGFSDTLIAPMKVTEVLSLG